MENIVHFDVAAVIMLLIILFANILAGATNTTTNRIFLILIITTLLGAVFNVSVAALENLNVLNDGLLYFLRTIYMLMHNFATPVYVIYLISLTRTWHKFKNHPISSVLIMLPYALEAILITANPWTGFFFTYENGVLYRKPAIVILYICASFYLLFGIGYVLVHRHLFRKRKITVLLSTIPLMAAAVFVKIYFPNSLVEIFSNAVSLMVISMTIQNPEKSIDTVTGLRKYSAYGYDVKIDYKNNKHHKIILINIANFDALRKLLGYESTNFLLGVCADNLKSLNKEYKAYADLYYLERGRFRVVFNSFYNERAEVLAEAINQCLKKPIKINGIEITLDAVICLTCCPEDIKDFKSLMAFGNDFHQRVNRTGEVILASELFKQRDFQLMNEMENIIEKAFINNSFQVYYQPIYSVEKKRFVSAEALLRLIDDDYGFVPPNLFIPAAERSGAIHKIGNIVLENVCRFIASDDFQSLNLDYIEINLSVVQCMHRELADNILSMIKKYEISPAKINLEITETAANYNQAIMIENMTKLINAGISFSLDDFGTGYSNLARVASLPLKIVKLDKTFVDNSYKPKLQIFLRGTIKMLKDMDMKIVVEGIETENMVTTFSELKCDYIQGYFYSKPIPEREFIEFIRESMISA